MTDARTLLAAKERQEVFTTSPAATVLEACRLMQQYRVGCLVVMERDKIVGIFTERDVINRVVADGKDAATTKVQEVMTRDVIAIVPERPIAEIEAIMKQRRIRHLPVAGAGRLIGLLSIGDVTAWHAAKDQQMVESLTEYLYGRH